MSSIHSPQHPFSRCGRVGFPQTIFHEDSKIALGLLLFHFTCFLFSVVMRPSTSSFICRPNLHTKQRCRVVAALPYGVMAFSAGLA